MGSECLWKGEGRNTEGYPQTIREVCSNYTQRGCEFIPRHHDKTIRHWCTPPHK